MNKKVEIYSSTFGVFNALLFNPLYSSLYLVNNIFFILSVP